MVEVSELMSVQLLTLPEDASLARARTEMRLARIRHVPVVDGEGRVLGILSKLDVARALASGEKGSLKVGEVMTRKVQMVSEDVPAHLAARILRDEKIGALPVVNWEGKLVGLVTAADFLEVAERALKGKPLVRPR